MKRNVPRFARLRGGVVGVLGAVALLAACEAKMPTSAEIAAMDVASMEKSAGALGVAPEKAAYYVDGKRVARAEAVALKPEDIVTVGLAKEDGQDIVQVHTRALVRLRPPEGSDPLDYAIERQKAAPLIIIDGVRSTAVALKALDRNSIEAVDIIKGAGAEREFGADAVNGVIRVVTKAGAKR